MGPIYLDNNATTPLLPEVLDAMLPYLTTAHGNPASSHQFGRRARQALEDAREEVAAILDADADEVIFTSGATEANNLAVFGLSGQPPGIILSSPIEHPSVAEAVSRRLQDGFTVHSLSVNADGVVGPDQLPPLLEPTPRLVTVMLANHETGSIQPVADLARMVEGRAPFHCDAVQAVGKMPVRFHSLGVTSLSLSAHKFHGPKGIGALLIRKDAGLQARTWGGHQQRGLRPGTEPVALAVGMATALRAAHDQAAERHAALTRLREVFLDSLKDAEPFRLNGAKHALAHALNISFPGCQADVLLMNLDLAGVACSTGSACSSGSLLPSPVLTAMKLDDERLRSAMRFSLSSLLSEQDVRDAARRIVAVVTRLRSTSNL
jgi:cysteine desulfurase